MFWTIIGVGVLTAVVAYFVDFILWTYVFTEGFAELTSLPYRDKEKMKAHMGPMLAKSALNTLVFGIAFVLIYVRLHEHLWASGVMGGMEFGTILWLPSAAVASIGNGIWFDKVRPLARANFWSWLIKMNIVGIVAALLIK
ncbi:MAG: hypothetical protein HY283_00260 [Nitrospirae bacterium]|nr:hypothetical protein [Nitrospirota bacterium]